MSDQPSVTDILGLLEQQFVAEAAGDWEATIQFNLSGDGGGSYYLSIGDGACTLTEGEAESATCTVVTEAQTWIDISTGKQNPTQAFMMGKLSLSGNMGDALKLQNTEIFPRP